jgi:hypothetical protein
MAHPSLYGFLENIRQSSTGDIIKEVVNFNEYLPVRNLTTTRRSLLNLLAVMEHDVGGMFLLMEDDLAGVFRKEDAPFISNNELTVAGHTYDRIVLTPLLMDFNTPSLRAKDIYYNRPPKKPMQKQIEDTLEGIKFYLKQRPKGLLEIYPFLGINPANYTFDQMRKFLNDYLGFSSISRHLFYKTFTALSQWDMGEPIAGKGLFAGVKLYPPLGFDPWPEEDKNALMKVNYLYEFCQKRRIPITTHCDDQGYRTIPIEQSQKWTSPHHWRKVLNHYPQLKLNFAHFGRQYSKRFGNKKEPNWYDAIIELCCEYDHVYTDFSFTGAKPDFYAELAETLADLPKPKRDVLSRKIMFGSDFMINLLEIDSYYDYYKLFDESPLSSNLKNKFCSENPSRFLFEK